MAYNIFLTQLQVKVHSFSSTDEMYTYQCAQFVKPKICYMGDDECKIHLDAIREVYMLAVLNLKMSCDRYPLPIYNLHNDELKLVI